AELRRGGPSANARWDNTVAILTGDYLFACASDLLADLGPESVRIQARTFQRLVHGQLHETLGPRPDEDPVAHYLAVLSDKTASLIATSTRLGAMHAGVSPEQVEMIARFGERIGMAVQLADDLLDSAGESAISGQTPGTDRRVGVAPPPALPARRAARLGQLVGMAFPPADDLLAIAGQSAISGKTPGTDLRAGVATLPVLYARRTARPGDERLLELISGPVADTEHAEALALLRAHP